MKLSLTITFSILFIAGFLIYKLFIYLRSPKKKNAWSQSEISAKQARKICRQLDMLQFFKYVEEELVGEVKVGIIVGLETDGKLGSDYYNHDRRVTYRDYRHVDDDVEAMMSSSGIAPFCRLFKILLERRGISITSWNLNKDNNASSFPNYLEINNRRFNLYTDNKPPQAEKDYVEIQKNLAGMVNQLLTENKIPEKVYVTKAGSFHLLTKEQYDYIIQFPLSENRRLYLP